MPARLRYQLQDIVLPAGVFVIGRGADCQLTLDDPQVSRRHAALRVDADGASLEDLGSRNGVFLNGVRVERSEPLHDGDQIRIGAQDFGYFGADGPAKPESSRRETIITTREELEASHAGPAPIQLSELRAHDPDDKVELTRAGTGPMGAVPARASAGLQIIGSVADKALALGRAEEAERILQRALADVEARAGVDEGPPAGGAPPVSVDPELAARAAGYAVRLAAATGRGTWIDYVFRLYTTLGLLMPAHLVDELYAAVRKVKHTEKPLLNAYITRLREVSPSLGPAERFILQRLEGLERWAP